MQDSPADEVDLLLGKMQAAASPLRRLLTQIYERHLENRSGAVADYIPELAAVDPDLFGISVVSVTGQAINVGDWEQHFSIQSVSKPFLFGLALDLHGREAVLRRVGVEPTGEAFNSIVLDEQFNRPFNPLVNAGAIATADLIPGKDFPERIKLMLKLFSTYIGHDVLVDTSIFMSERATGHRNRAITHLMRNFGMVSEKCEESLELYFQQCSLMVTARDLAVMGATLANRGVNPLTGQRAIRAEHVKDVLSIMLSCGMYDYAGEWAFRVGLPAKSGVGGGIVAVAPGVGGIAVFSPRLDSKGNSVRGLKVCEDLSKHFALHAFASPEEGESLAAALRRPQ